MQMQIHVKSLDDLPAARETAAQYEQQGDEVTIVVAQPVSPKPAERQERKGAR